MASYESRGVSPHKQDVHKAIANVSPGVFPGAFCKAIPDLFGGSDDHCVLMHADGAGTKSSLAYLYYREHGAADVFEGIAQDSLVMNLDDLLCVGATGPFALTNLIGRNAKLVSGEVVAAVINGYEKFCHHMAEFGIEIVTCGGETADIGDLVRTIVVDSALATRMPRAEFIDASQVKPGLSIVGVASFGRASYEEDTNSGIGTNGFTCARHELLGEQYRQAEETYAPQIAELAYTGKFDLDDPLPGSNQTVGQALLSPTRTYAPLLKEAFATFRPAISALFHNTGGGLSKSLGFGHGIRYVKDNLIAPPPIFQFLAEQTNLPAQELSRVFNMGCRLEIVCQPDAAQGLIDLCRRFQLHAQVIGRTEKIAAGTEVVLETPTGRVEFRKP
jgi:phosphoribosylformylglycinamidine cyclo-ligase